MFSNLRQHKAHLAPILFSLLVFQSGGWFAAWHAAWTNVRREAQSAILHPDSGQFRTRISLEKFAAIRLKDREIRIGDQFFDIRSEQILGDSIDLELYRDMREESLFSALDQLLGFSSMASDSPLPAPLQVLLLQWLQPAFLLPEGAVCPAIALYTDRPAAPGSIPIDQVALTAPGIPPESPALSTDFI